MNLVACLQTEERTYELKYEQRCFAEGEKYEVTHREKMSTSFVLRRKGQPDFVHKAESSRAFTTHQEILKHETERLESRWTFLKACEIRSGKEEPLWFQGGAFKAIHDKDGKLRILHDNGSTVAS